MKRVLPASSVILLLSIGLSACGGAYTVPSRGIDADIQASRGSGSATLFHNNTLNFGDAAFPR